MSECIALVGLDVHEAQSVTAVLDPVSGELRVERLRGVPGDVVPGVDAAASALAGQAAL